MNDEEILQKLIKEIEAEHVNKKIVIGFREGKSFKEDPKIIHRLTRFVFKEAQKRVLQEVVKKAGSTLEKMGLKNLLPDNPDGDENKL